MIKKIAFVLLLLLISNCTKKKVVGTETDTGEITGWVVYKDKSGVNGADVILRDSDNILMVTVGTAHNGSLMKRTAGGGTGADSTRTSPAGFFSFEEIEFGDYLVEINDHDSLGAVVEASVTEEEPRYDVDSVVLRHYGTVSGNIDKSLVEDDTTFIYIIELDRQVQVDSLGYFLIENVPVHAYSLRIVENGEVIPSPLDTVTVTVAEEDTTELLDIGTEFGSIRIKGTVKEE